MYLFLSRLFNVAGDRLTGRQLVAERQVALLLVLQMAIPAVFAQGVSSPVTHPEVTDANTAVPVVETFSFPAWPQRSQFKKELIPPPPPGPYMSSALSDHSVKPRSFGMNFQQHERPMQGNQNRFSMPVDVPMDVFSPDLAWPELRPGVKQSNNRWMPTNGYRYVEPNQSSPQYNRYHQKPYPLNYGHNYPNRTGVNMPAGMPVMPMGRNVR